MAQLKSLIVNGATRLLSSLQVSGDTNINGTLYLSGAIGSATAPVYVDAAGKFVSTTSVVAAKLTTSTLGSTTQPIYLAAGVATACNTYAGGTAVTLNNVSKAASTASFYAPTSGGTSGYPLIGKGTTSAPDWYAGATFSGTQASDYKLTLAGTTDASSTTTGSLVVPGGVGIAKKLYVGGLATIGTLDGGQHIINGNVQINAQSGSYNEGLRINRSTTGYANIYLGCSRNSSSGNQTGGWWIGTLSTPADATSTGDSVTNTVLTISQGSTDVGFAFRGVRGTTRVTNSYWELRPRLVIVNGSTSTSDTGWARLTLGNSVATSSSSSHSEGKIEIYSAGTAEHIIVGASTTTAYTHTLPNSTGYLVSSGSTSAAVGSNKKPIYISSSGVATAFDTTIGSTTAPVYVNASGELTAGSTYAGGTFVNLNGTDKGANSIAIYAPTTSGTKDSQGLVSNGANAAPVWKDISATVTIGAGTSSATPTVKITVLGVTGAAQSITMASTSVYGATILTDTYSSTNDTKAATGKSILAAINSLDVTAVGITTAADGNKFLCGISETDGKISATVSTKTIGSASIPVYVNAGVITQCTATSVFSDFSITTTSGTNNISLTICGQTRTVSITPSTIAVFGNYVLKSGDTMSGALTITDTTAATSKTTGALKVTGGISSQANIYGDKVYGAVWNDYAEYRSSLGSLAPGDVVRENENGKLQLTNERLMPGAEVVTDTFGFAIGETKIANTPIAVAGRVLVTPYQDRNNYKPGMAVCSAPGGTVDIMTRTEIAQYPDCIVGIVSEIPDYDTWNDNICVHGRIWIKVK